MPTAVTKKVGKAGSPSRDYSTMAALMSGLPSDIRAGTGTDEDWTVEFYNDDGTALTGTPGDAGFQFSTLTDSTHQLRLVAAAGHSWRDSVDPASEAVRYDPANGVAIENSSHRGSAISMSSQGYITVRGIQTRSGWYGINLYQGNGANPCLIEDCFAVITNWATGISVSGSGSIARNNYVFIEGGGSSGASMFDATYGAEIYSNTGLVGGSAQGIGVFGGGAGSGVNPALKIQNNAVFNVLTAITPMTVSGVTTVTNNASDATFDAMFDASNIDGLDKADQFVDPTGTASADINLALKSGNDLASAGVAVTGVTDDAYGATRASSPTIGAQEWVVSGGGTLSAAIGQASETVTVFGVTRTKSKAIGLLSETDSVFSVTRSKSKAVGLNTETDAATRFAKSAAIGMALETDSGQAVTRSKTRPLGQPSETDTPIGFAGSTPIGLASETDSVPAMARSKSKAIGIVTEAYTIQAVSASKRAAVGLASEADTTQPATPVRTKAIGQTSEIDSIAGVDISKVRAIGRATETDTAQPITNSGYVAPAPTRRKRGGMMVNPGTMMVQ